MTYYIGPGEGISPTEKGNVMFQSTLKTPSYQIDGFKIEGISPAPCYRASQIAKGISVTCVCVSCKNCLENLRRDFDSAIFWEGKNSSHAIALRNAIDAEIFRLNFGSIDMEDFGENDPK